MYNTFVTVTDNVTHVVVSKQISVDVVGVPPKLPFISPYGNAFQDVSLGQAFSQGVSVHNGGRAPFAWTALGLPQGVSIRSAIGTTGGNISPGDAEIWGNSTIAGLYNITFTVTDADGVTASNTFALRVSPLALTNYLNNGTIGQPVLEHDAGDRRHDAVHRRSSRRQAATGPDTQRRDAGCERRAG